MKTKLIALIALMLTPAIAGDVVPKSDKEAARMIEEGRKEYSERSLWGKLFGPAPEYWKLIPYDPAEKALDTSPQRPDWTSERQGVFGPNWQTKRDQWGIVNPH